MLNYNSTRKKTVDYINSMSSKGGGSSVHRYKCICQRSDNSNYVGFLWDTQTDTTDANTLSLEIANVLRQSQTIGIAAASAAGNVYVVGAKDSSGPGLVIARDNVDLTLSIVKLY